MFLSWQRIFSIKCLSSYQDMRVRGQKGYAAVRSKDSEGSRTPREPGPYKYWTGRWSSKPIQAPADLADTAEVKWMDTHLLFLFLVYKHYVCGVYVCETDRHVYLLYVCGHTTYNKVWTSKDKLQELALPFYHASPSDQAQAMRLCKHMYPLSLYPFTLSITDSSYFESRLISS